MNMLQVVHLITIVVSHGQKAEDRTGNMADGFGTKEALFLIMSRK